MSNLQISKALAHIAVQNCTIVEIERHDILGAHTDAFVNWYQNQIRQYDEDILNDILVMLEEVNFMSVADRKQATDEIMKLLRPVEE